MAQLPIVTLGTTGLRVTNLCLGGAPLGDMPETFAYGVPEERALDDGARAARQPDQLH